MITRSLSEVARVHCAASRPRMNLRGFVSAEYGVGLRFFERVAIGRKKPSRELLGSMNNAHVRLFPTEPVLLILPGNHPPVLLGHHIPTANN